MVNKLFWYEYLFRGFSIGCQPKGFIGRKDEYGRFGAIAYDRALTDKELSDYELKPIQGKS